MTIEAELFDGTILEFPDNTPDGVIRTTVARETGQRQGQRVGTIKPESPTFMALDKIGGETVEKAGRRLSDFAPFPGMIDFATNAPVPESQKNLNYLLNPMPRIVGEVANKVIGPGGEVARMAGEDAAKLARDTMVNAPFMPGIGGVTRGLRDVLGRPTLLDQTPKLSQMRDVTPKAPLALTAPAEGMAQPGVAPAGQPPPGPGLIQPPALRLPSPPRPVATVALEGATYAKRPDGNWVFSNGDIVRVPELVQVLESQLAGRTSPIPSGPTITLPPPLPGMPKAPEPTPERAAAIAQGRARIKSKQPTTTIDPIKDAQRIQSEQDRLAAERSGLPDARVEQIAEIEGQTRAATTTAFQNTYGRLPVGDGEVIAAMSDPQFVKAVKDAQTQPTAIQEAGGEVISPVATAQPEAQSGIIPGMGIKPGEYEKAIEHYGKTAAGFDPRFGKTVGFLAAHRPTAGQKLWENMTADERLAEFRQYAKEDYAKAIEESKGNTSEYLLDRALDPLDPMAEFYKEVLKRQGAEVTDRGIKLPQQMQQEIDAKAHQAATSPLNNLPEPTQAQKEAGNYKKGHISWNGLDITIENPKGSIRKGVDKGGQPWEVTMPAHYGYLKRSEGADGDQVDVYIGEYPADPEKVFVIDQFDPANGKFDEHKVVINARTKEEAALIYDNGFSDRRGPQRRGDITELTVDQFKEWLRKGDTKGPLSEAGPVETPAAPAPSQPGIIESAPPGGWTEADKVPDQDKTDLPSKFIWEAKGDSRIEKAAADYLNSKGERNITKELKSAEVFRSEFKKAKGFELEVAYTIREAQNFASKVGDRSPDQQQIVKDFLAGGRGAKLPDAKPDPLAGVVGVRNFPSAAIPAAPAQPDAPGTLMGKPVSLLEVIIDSDGIKHELYLAKEGGGFVKVVDHNTADTLDIKYYPILSKAVDAFEQIKTERPTQSSSQPTRPPISITMPVRSPFGDDSETIPADKSIYVKNLMAAATITRIDRLIESGAEMTPELQAEYDRAKMQRLKYILDKRASGVSISIDEEDFIEDMQKPPRDHGKARRARIARFEKHQQEIIAGAEAIINDPNSNEETIQAAVEAMKMAKTALGIADQAPELSVEVPELAPGNPVISEGEPQEEAPPPEPKSGDWVEYEDSWGKTHQGKVDAVFNVETRPYIPGVPVDRQPKGRIETTYHIVDASGKAMISPANGTTPRIIEAPVAEGGGAAPVLPEATAPAIAPVRELDEPKTLEMLQEERKWWERELERLSTKNVGIGQIPEGYAQAKDHIARIDALIEERFGKGSKDVTPATPGPFDSLVGQSFSEGWVLARFTMSEDEAIKAGYVEPDTKINSKGKTITVPGFYRPTAKGASYLNQYWTSIRAPKNREQYRQFLVEESKKLPLTKGEISVSWVNPKGKWPIDAQLSANFAIHKRMGGVENGRAIPKTGPGSGGFIISHKSGGSVGEAKSIAEAKIWVAAFEREGINWDFMDNKDMPKGVGAKGAQIRQAMINDDMPQFYYTIQGEEGARRPAVAPSGTKAETEEVTNVPGQSLPDTSGMDVRESAGAGEGVAPAGQVEEPSGSEGAIGTPLDDEAQGGVRAPGGRGVRTGGGRGTRASGRKGSDGRSPTTTDTGPGEESDIPEAGSVGDSGEPQESGAVSPRPPRANLGENYRLPKHRDWLPSGAKARVLANLEAIRIVKQLDIEKRPATPEEKEALSKWVGWGGLKQVFDLGKAYFREKPPPEWKDTYKSWQRWEKTWGESFDAVKAALTREEWDTAFASTANAHYTSREIINQIWTAVERLGFKGGNALEPAAGSGNFIGLIPDELAKQTHWRAVEMDEMTAKIVSKLYPEVRVETGQFEKSSIKPNSQDLVISNVPFLAIDRTPHIDKRYPHLALHNYFFVRGLDLVKPGGLMVAITSMSTMDAPVSEIGRNLIAEKADLVAAIRLPNIAFAKNANTEVSTDLLFFRKKNDELISFGNEFKGVVMSKTYDGRDIQINEYFAQKPEQILGRMSLEGTQYAKDEAAVLPKRAYGNEELDEDEILTGSERIDRQLNDLYSDLELAIQALPENVFGAVRSAPEPDRAIVPASLGAKRGRLEVHNKTVKKVNDAGELEAVPWGSDRKMVEQTKAYLSAKDSGLKLVEMERGRDTTDDDLVLFREDLNRKYDDYVRRYGPFNGSASRFLDEDGDFPFALSLESPKTILTEGLRKGVRVNRRETVYEKSQIFTTRVNFPDPTPESADTVEDGAQISLNFRGKIDADYISQLTGLDVDKVKIELEAAGLAFENPATGLWESRSEYLGGEVKQKLQVARGAAQDDPRYIKHVEELEKVQPEPWAFENIGFRLGSKWLPPELIKEFLEAELGVVADVSMTPETATWHITVKGGAYNELNLTVHGYQSDRERRSILGHKLVELALNLKSPEIKRIEDAPETKKGTREVKDPIATTEAEWKQSLLQDLFQSFVSKRPDWQAQIESIFNERFNTTVDRVFDAPSWDYYPGASHSKKPREHQKKVITRAIGESVGLFHGVGTGKTLIIVTWAMELKRLGLANKTMIVTQNATTEQFARTFREQYPWAKVLAPAEKERSAKQRQTLMARIATEQWDAIIVPQSFFDMIPDDPERVRKYIRDRLDQLVAIMNQAAAAEGKNSPRVKDLRDAVADLRERLLSIADRKTDDIYTFEDLGIDALAVDESHSYKKLEFSTALQNIKGLDSSANKRGLGMLMKTRYVLDKRNGKNVIFATGTPVSNTIAEAWHLMRYLRPSMLEEWNVTNFDEFVGLFVTPRTALEMGPTGNFKMQTRLAKFSNQPALMQMWKSMADVKLAEDLELPGVPSIKGGKPQTIEVQKTPELEKFIDELNEMLEAFQAMSGREKRKNRHIPLVVFGLARKSSLDMRMINPKLPDQPGSKLNTVVANMLRIYKESTDVKGTQMGFIDLYQDDPDNPQFNAYEEIKRKLIAGGIPEREILVMSDKIKGARREALFKQLNDGEIRIALGSRERMGVGVNAQEHIVAIHQIDVPHRPMDIEQSNGRGLRQRENTEIPEIEILYYGVKGTLDAAMYDQLATKSKWIAQLLKGNLPGFNFNDPYDEASLSYDQQMAILSGNPGAVRKIALENEIRQLEAARAGYTRGLREATETARTLESTTIPAIKERIVKADERLARLNPITQAPEPSAKISGGDVAGRKNVTAALDDFFKRKAEALIKAAGEEAARGGSVQSKPFTEVSINGFPLEMLVRVKSEIVDVVPGTMEQISKVYEHSIEYRKRFTEAFQEGKIKAIWDAKSAEVYWRFVEPGHGEFTNANFAEGTVTKGEGLLHSIQAAMQRISREPEDARNSLQSKEKDLRNLTSFIGVPFSKEADLEAARKELRELRISLGETAAARSPGATPEMVPEDDPLIVDAGSDEFPTPGEEEVKIEMAEEDEAKIEGLNRSLLSAMESGDMKRANELRKQIDKIRNDSGT